MNEESRTINGDIVKAMDSAVEWARELGGVEVSSDNDNDSGEVYFTLGSKRRAMMVRANGNDYLVSLLPWGLTVD